MAGLLNQAPVPGLVAAEPSRYKPAPVQPAVAQPQQQAAPNIPATKEEVGVLNGLFKDPERLQMILAGLGMATADNRNQQDRYVGMMGQTLADKAAHLRGAPEREQEAELRRHAIAKAAREGEAYDAYQGLLGTPGEEAPANPHAAVVGGTGYRGGEMDGREFATRVAGLPGYESAGLGLLSKYTDAETENAAKVGPFANYKDFHAAQQAMQKDYSNQAADYRRAIINYGAVTDLVSKRGSFEAMTGADDVALIKYFVKTVTPKESVMSDDVRGVVQSSGLPGTVQSYLAAFEGKGQLGRDQRAQIYQTMTDLNEASTNELRSIRESYLPAITEAGFGPDKIFRSLPVTSPFQGGLLAPETAVNNPEGYDIMRFKIEDPRDLADGPVETMNELPSNLGAEEAPSQYLAMDVHEGVTYGLTEGGQWIKVPELNKTTVRPTEMERLGKGAQDVTAGVEQGLLYHTDPVEYGKFTKNRDEDLEYYNRAMKEWNGDGIDWFGLGGEAGMLGPLGAASFGRTAIGKGVSATLQGGAAGSLLYTPEDSSRIVNTGIGAVGGLATVPMMSAGKTAIGGGVKTAINALNKFRSAIVPDNTLAVRIQNVFPDITALNTTIKDKVLAEARRQMEMTGAIDADALQRVARAEELGFQGPSASTTGQATRDGTLFDRERNLAKLEDGAPLRSRFTAQNRRLGVELREELPRSSVPNVESGDAVIKAVNDRWDQTQLGVSKVYDMIEIRHGDATIDDGLPSFQGYLRDSDNALDVTADPVMDSIRRKVDKMGLSGDEPAQVTLKQVESLRKFIGKISKNTKDPNIKRVKRESIDALDDAVIETFGDDVFKAARAKATERFDRFSTQLVKKIVDGDTSGDKLYQRVLSADAADVEQMKYVLKSGGEQGAEAWQALRSKTLDDIWEQAAPYGADREFRPDTYRRALNKIGEKKLKILFTPDEYKRLENIQKASVDTMVAPPFDTINRANTAPTLINLMRRIPSVGGEVAGRVGDAMEAGTRQFEVERAVSGSSTPELSLDEVIRNMEALSQGRVGQALKPAANAVPMAPGLLFQESQRN